MAKRQKAPKTISEQLRRYIEDSGVSLYARPLAHLVRVTEEVGEGIARVAVQRDEDHVVAAVEDGLRAVAVVEIHVEDGHPPGPTVEEGLGGDGCVVEEAIAAVEVARRVMPGRSAEREGGYRIAAS